METSNEIIYGKINVKIQGISPLLMNRLDITQLNQKVRSRYTEKDLKKDAEHSAYIDEIDGKNQLYVPCEALYSMLIAASSNYKTARVSVSRLLAGSIHIEPAKVPLGTDEYTIDVRAVRIKDARVPHARAKLDKWELEFSIVYDKTFVNNAVLDMLEEIIIVAGRRYGLLDYRPQHKGWFGTFVVKEFKVDE